MVVNVLSLQIKIENNCVFFLSLNTEETNIFWIMVFHFIITLVMVDSYYGLCGLKFS